VQSALDREARFDLSTNNDIVGGNSGSALIDTAGRLVGLMFTATSTRSRAATGSTPS